MNKVFAASRTPACDVVSHHEAALLARDMGKEDDINRVLADLRSEPNRLAGQDKLHVEQQMRKLDRKRSEMHLY